MQKTLSPYVFALALIGLAVSCVGYLLGFNLPVSVFAISLLVAMFGGLLSALQREGGANIEDIVTMVVAVAFSLWLIYRLFR